MLKRIATASIALTLVAAGAAYAAAQSGTVVDIHKTSHGKVLATSKGRTLYLYTPDGKNKSHCTGSCAAIWPPLKTTGKPKAGMGVRQSLLGQTSKHQVTYHGHPLYTYTGDSKAGQTNGEGSGGTWFVVTASGKKK